ncbi:hypothetical protein RchiOBHm_Chr6g0289011 [Rosa chinensis]|uniref:Uncharacterized protein n=1 Tax=Rosa chinensis TaxID=74649 RepID=A0A2P6PVI2_ROSCH|nr:hypothetical protein RchiOBHm_Chr6g0289011 [Rosa chinensis]
MGGCGHFFMGRRQQSGMGFARGSDETFSMSCWRVGACGAQLGLAEMFRLRLVPSGWRRRSGDDVSLRHDDGGTLTATVASKIHSGCVWQFFYSRVEA